jgi:hypothetical protein
MYNIIIEFGVSMELVRLIKMCFNETYSNVRIRKHVLFKMISSKEMSCCNCFQICFRIRH